MLKLLVVDDEESARQGISSTIDWASNGIELCGDAANGAEALEIAYHEIPNIVLTDIRMPVMDGLELAKILSCKWPEIKIIIMSGYDEFSYAQQALKYGIMDYLLKPSKPITILEAVLKAKDSIEAQKNKERIYQQLRSNFQESIPVLANNFLRNLLHNKSKKAPNIQAGFKLYGISLSINNIMAAVFSIDRHADSDIGFKSDDIELMKFAVKNIAQEIIGGSYRCEVLEDGDYIVSIINIDDNRKELIPVLEKVRESISRLLEFSVTIGVGNFQDDIRTLFVSYREAIYANKAKFIMGNNSIIEYESLPDSRGSSDNQGSAYPLPVEKEMISCFKSADESAIQPTLEAFFYTIIRDNCRSSFIINSCLALLFSIYHLCVEKNVDTDEIFGSDLSDLNDLAESETIDQLKLKVLNIIKVAFNQFNFSKNNNTIIELALQYIKENYASDISRESVASAVFVTPGYLSLLFRRKLNLTFIEYLNKVRIENACKYLKNTRLKTYEIATAVGYYDEKYFSHVFKKYIGYTPSQYRKT